MAFFTSAVGTLQTLVIALGAGLGSQALQATITRLKERIADYETQTELAASTDIVE